MGIENAILIGVSHQMALRNQMDVVANNVANMNTTAFRAESILFREYLVETPEGAPMSYVQDYGTARDLREGPIRSTGNPLDLAISGDGYLAVDTGDDILYTRNGHLRLDEQGRLVTMDGDPVLDINDQPIEFADPSVEVFIARDGTVTAADGQQFRLGVVNFEDEQALDKVEGGLYRTDQAPFAVDKPAVLQGMLEDANVNAIAEMTRMIEIQRAYESMQRMVNTDHDLQRDAIDRIGQVV